MSDVEKIKAESRALRGGIAASLDAGGTRFADDDAQLIKFHGIYQQEDRDLRADRKRAGLEPYYQFMLRTRVPGGVLSAEQYLVHDDLAERFGNGTLRVTTRQGLQLHGLLKGNLRPIVRALTAASLTSLAACGDVNRNVMACPSEPATALEAAAQSLAQRLAEHFTPRTGAYHEIWIDGERADVPEFALEPVDPIYGRTYLPRKFKMAVALPHDNCVDAYAQDLAFVAEGEPTCEPGYTVFVGGGLGMTHGKPGTYPRAATPFAFVSADRAIAVAEAIVATQRDLGDRSDRRHARLKYLVEERGVDWLRAEVERRLGYLLDAPHPTALRDVCDHLGWSAQSDGRWTLGVHVQSGRIQDVPQTRTRSALRDVVGSFAPAIRLTGQQNVLLVNVDAGDRERVDRALRACGVASDPASLGVRRYAMACPAIPTCGLAVAESERVLPELLDELSSALTELGMADERLSVRMTGCPNGCARPYMGDVGLVGRSRDLYDVYVGGDWANTRLNWPLETGVPRAAIVPMLRPFLHAWRERRIEAETFGDFCTRLGREGLACATLDAPMR